MAKSTKTYAEKSEYNHIQAKLLTRIHEWPTRPDYDQIVKELGSCSITIKLPTYDWSKDANSKSYCALSIISKMSAYLAKIGFVYAAPDRLPAFDPSINTSTSNFQIREKTDNHKEKKEKYTFLEGTEETMCENIQDTLDPTYYKHLHDKILGYTAVTFVNYLKHLIEKW